MCFSIFGRFSKELDLLVVTVQISTARSPQISRQNLKILSSRPFCELIVILRSKLAEFFEFWKNRPGAETEKRDLSYRLLFRIHSFVKSWGGVYPTPRAYPPL